MSYIHTHSHRGIDVYTNTRTHKYIYAQIKMRTQVDTHTNIFKYKLSHADAVLPADTHFRL